MPGFDWKSFAIKMLTLAPVIVAGVEQIHGATTSGATKRDIAQASLALAVGVADNVLPAEDSNMADSIAQSTGPLIDSIVSIFNTAGIFSHKS